ncbi:DNA mismatch repair protein MutS-like isoform X2 [Oscarella lobularis]|uniref:DNA mismatch repair protein MutS-like isoform X2 n=1 Tax=Oscarella lobularis TaxID=121494 RepID=UPI0033135155
MLASLKFVLRCSRYARTAVNLVEVVRHASTKSPDLLRLAKTPLFGQFTAIKKQHPDCLLLFQVGDFYELYGDDAELAGGRTSLRVTQKSGVPMAGFPVRSLDDWTKVLVEEGFKLAICNQTPDKSPATSKLFHRRVIRLVTPGTVLEPVHPDANYLMAIATGPGQSLGLAWMDISTGEFKIGLSSVESLSEDLERIRPTELLVPVGFLDRLSDSMARFGNRGFKQRASQISNQLQEIFTNELADDYWKTSQLKVSSDLEAKAASALIQYVEYTQKSRAPILNAPSQFSSQEHMAIDPNTRRALELTRSWTDGTKRGSLLNCIDKTVTASGKRLIQSQLCSPLLNVARINRRLDAVNFFHSNKHLAHSVQLTLKKLPDVERLFQKISVSNSSTLDLNSLLSAIQLAEEIKVLVMPVAKEKDEERLLNGLDVSLSLRTELENSVQNIGSDGNIMEGYSKELDDLRGQLASNEEAVESLCAKYRSSCGIARLAIVPNKHFSRVVEVPASSASKFIQSLSNETGIARVGQTTVKVRFSTAKLQELNGEYQRISAAISDHQNQVFQSLCQKVSEHAGDIKSLSSTLARLDIASSLALVAHDRGYVRPVMSDGIDFEVEGGFHPVVDALQPENFIENDCDLTAKRLWIVTGPNMGGKSTFLRQNALISLMAQMGSFVPASSAKLGIVDRLFARVGASDNLAKYQSTFMTEMVETATILTQATKRSLVVLDEIGRGTSTLDGLAIAWSVLEHLHSDTKCRTLSATHFTQLGRLTSKLSKSACYQAKARRTDDGVQFTFKIEPGICSESFGIDVARLAGVPDNVTKRAKEMLEQMSLKEENR